MASNYVSFASPWATAGQGLQELASMILGMHADKKADVRRKEDIARGERHRTEDLALRERERQEGFKRDDAQRADTVNFRNQQAKEENARTLLPYTSPNVKMNTRPFMGTGVDALFSREIGFGADRPASMKIGGIDVQGFTPGEVSIEGQRGPSFAESQGMAANTRADRAATLAENADRRAGAMHDLDFGLGQMRNDAFKGLDPFTQRERLTGGPQPERPQFDLSFDSFNPDGSQKFTTVQTNRPGVSVNRPPPIGSPAHLNAVWKQEYDRFRANGLASLPKVQGPTGLPVYKPEDIARIDAAARASADRARQQQSFGGFSGGVVDAVTIPPEAKTYADGLLALNSAKAKSLTLKDIMDDGHSQTEAEIILRYIAGR